MKGLDKMKITLIGIILFSTILCSKEPVSLKKIFQDTFSKATKVSQKEILLTSNEKKTLEKQAKAKIDSNKIHFYVVKKSNAIVGYGVMLVQRIRTKKAAILYLIDKNEQIQNIEILVFHEPNEYKPYSTWKETFIGKSSKDDLRAGYDIPTISGSTLSARAITNASRIALAIVSREKN